MINKFVLGWLKKLAIIASLLFAVLICILPVPGRLQENLMIWFVWIPYVLTYQPPPMPKVKNNTLLQAVERSPSANSCRADFSSIAEQYIPKGKSKRWVRSYLKNSGFEVDIFPAHAYQDSPELVSGNRKNQSAIGYSELHVTVEFINQKSSTVTAGRHCTYL